MPKYFLAALLGLGGLAAHAQTTLPAGTWQLGGNVGFFQQHSESAGGGAGNSNTSKSFSLNPSVGYLAADNLAIGLEAGLAHDQSRNVDGYGLSSSSRTNWQYFAGVFTDYYRLFNQYFGLKGRLNASYSHFNSNYQYYNANDAGSYQGRGNGLGANLVPSLLFFPVSKLALGASFGGLSYNYGWSTQSPNIINNEGHGYSFGAYFGLNQLAFSGTFFPGRK